MIAVFAFIVLAVLLAPIYLIFRFVYHLVPGVKEAEIMRMEHFVACSSAEGFTGFELATGAKVDAGTLYNQLEKWVDLGRLKRRKIVKPDGRLEFRYTPIDNSFSKSA